MQRILTPLGYPLNLKRKDGFGGSAAPGTESSTAGERTKLDMRKLLHFPGNLLIIMMMMMMMMIKYVLVRTVRRSILPVFRMARHVRAPP